MNQNTTPQNFTPSDIYYQQDQPTQEQIWELEEKQYPEACFFQDLEDGLTVEITITEK